MIYRRFFWVRVLTLGAAVVILCVNRAGRLRLAQRSPLRGRPLLFNALHMQWRARGYPSLGVSPASPCFFAGLRDFWLICPHNQAWDFSVVYCRFFWVRVLTLGGGVVILCVSRAGRLRLAQGSPVFFMGDPCFLMLGWFPLFASPVACGKITAQA